MACTVYKHDYILHFIYIIGLQNIVNIILFYQSTEIEDIENDERKSKGNGVAGTANGNPIHIPEAAQTEEERLLEAYKNMPFDEKDNDEWILVALVLDNLLGWIFFALLIVTTSMVLVMPLAQTLRHDQRPGLIFSVSAQMPNFP